jgi:hypothetical protein
VINFVFVPIHHDRTVPHAAQVLADARTCSRPAGTRSWRRLRAAAGAGFDRVLPGGSDVAAQVRSVLAAAA